MSNITKKDRNLIKGAIRRVFSRSALRIAVVNAAQIQHSDASRPRVKKWCLCAICKQPEAKSYVEVDHIEPVVKIDSSFEDMTLDEFVDRLWCDIKGLQVVCESCHDKKTAEEQKVRKLKRTSKR